MSNNKMITYPSTDQLNTLVYNVNKTYNFIGLDKNGDAIHDHTLPKPKLTFKGTVKIHGMNAGISYNDNGMWVQSRKNIITVLSDNARYAFFVETKKDFLISIFDEIKKKYTIDTKNQTITIYSEWCGSGIQKGVGINNIEKSMFIFGIKISPLIINELSDSSYWVDSSGFSSNENRIYNILDFKTYEIEIDFNQPQLAQNKIIELTIEVEDECPVAKSFGFPNTIGEGIVFSYLNEKGQRQVFKSKGEKHAGASKVKVLKPVDDVKINKVIDVVNQITPIWRLDQMITETFNTLNGGVIEMKGIGTYIKAVMNDIVKEELVTLAENDLAPKDVGKYVSEVAKKYFFQRFNDEIGLK